MKKNLRKWKLNDARHAAIEKKRNNFIGKRFDRLLVVKFHHNDKSHSYWEVICDCGNKRIVNKQSLTRKTSRSCGCYKTDLFIKRLSKHGLSKTNIYKVWHAMIQRCLNPNCTSYKNYGGRGIKVDPSWTNFKMFFERFGKFRPEKYQIDRIDNDGPYSLKNCRWTTHHEQQKNKRQTIWVSLNGQTKCVKDWCKIYGIAKNTALYRLSHGWTAEETFGLIARKSATKLT